MNFFSRSCREADCLVLFNRISLSKTISLAFLVTASIFRSVLLFFVDILRDRQFWAEIDTAGNFLLGLLSKRFKLSFRTSAARERARTA